MPFESESEGWATIPLGQQAAIVSAVTVLDSLRVRERRRAPARLIISWTLLA